MLAETQERLARNESLFREVNERIRDAGEQFRDSPEQEYEFFCECPDVACVERVALTLAEYEEIRQDPRRFLVAPGHDVPEIEHVVEEEPATIVEKDGPAGAIAVQLDPRA